MRSRTRIWERSEASLYNQNLNVDEYIAIAERQLTPQRFKHSLGVMQMMGELAAIYNIDEAAALTAGILHDIAKEFTPDDLIQWADENNILLRSEYDRMPLFLHGPVGACYSTRTLGVTDPMILDAISWHSYFGDGVAQSPSFCWCLRLADLLEPSRNWEELKMQLKPVAYAGELAEAAYLLMQWLIPFHESASLPVHPNMHRVFHELSTLREEKRVREVDSLPV
jgi:predicted HD superfamily hydrolase involved in NAD metabolism